MKGLEISEVRYSELEKTIRFDAEFYSPIQLMVEQQLNQCQTYPLSSYLKCLSDGNHMGISDEFCNRGIPYYRGGDVHTFFIENSRPEYCISEDIYNRPVLKRSHLAKNDVLVTIVGTIGNVAIVTTDNKATCNCKLAIARPRDVSESSYIAIYLKSSFGQNQIKRIVRGSVQMGMLLDDLRELSIPKFSEEFTDKITDIVGCALSEDNISKRCIVNAENDLLRELGFANWEPSTKTISVRKYSDFVSAGRFDAEYFQPDFELIEKQLAGYSSGSVCAADILQTGLVRNGSSKEKYVELANIGTSGEIVDCTEAPFEQLPSRARQRIRKGDVIVSSIEGSLERCALVDDEYDGALCSTGFHRFRSVAINPETLMLLFKSAPIQSLLKRGCSGTILCGILPGEFKRIWIPLIRKSIQEELAVKVQSSFAARKESKRLLDLAKHAVELAIKHGESAGMDVLAGK